MSDPKSTKLEATESNRLNKWQNKLLPWFVAMPTLLVGVFIYLATQQMVRFNDALQTKPDSLLIGKILPLPDSPLTDPSLRNNMEYIQWVTLTRLEQESYFRRYNQAGILVMSRIFTKYLAFFTGMVLAIVGSVFIIGKIRESETNFEGSFSEKIKFNILSSSPGILFAVLGTMLMLAAILKHNDVTVQDSPLYLTPQSIMAIELSRSGVQLDTTKLSSSAQELFNEYKEQK